jgi:hypothetical protein
MDKGLYLEGGNVGHSNKRESDPPVMPLIKL